MKSPVVIEIGNTGTKDGSWWAYAACRVWTTESTVIRTSETRHSSKQAAFRGAYGLRKNLEDEIIDLAALIQKSRKKGKKERQAS